MANPALTDKAPLDDYLSTIAEAVVGAVAQVETDHPDWRVSAVDLVVRCALRPEAGADGSLSRVWADMDVSHSQLVNEIPLSLRRTL